MSSKGFPGLPSQSPGLSAEMFSKLAGNPDLSRHDWYIVAAVTFTVLGRLQDLQTIYSMALSEVEDPSDESATHERQLNISRKIREAIIKAVVIVGMPKPINAIFALRSITPDRLIDKENEFSLTGRRHEMYEQPSKELFDRGFEYAHGVYGQEALKKNESVLFGSGTEDLGLVGFLGYAYVLSNLKVLSPVETEYVLICGLIPQDTNLQLVGHLQGALNFGATVEQVRAVRQTCISICEACGMKMLPKDTPGGYGWCQEVANI